MLMLFETKNYIRGDTIYKEGDKANCIYLIKRGEVQISQKIDSS